MKTKMHSTNSRGLIFLAAITFVIIGIGKIEGQTENTNQSVEDKVVTLLDSYNHSPNPNVDLWRTFNNFSDHRQQVIQSLIKIFNDPKSLPFSTPKCYSAYLLGVMRASEAIDCLAAQITVQGPPGHGLVEPLCGYEPAADALIVIGNPAIPAVIRNLAESDDTKMRETSLRVLTKIDGDKDISLLRLQKAFAAEKDSAKKARLQAALKELSQ